MAPSFYSRITQETLSSLDKDLTPLRRDNLVPRLCEGDLWQREELTKSHFSQS